MFLKLRSQQKSSCIAISLDFYQNKGYPKRSFRTFLKVRESERESARWTQTQVRFTASVIEKEKWRPAADDRRRIEERRTRIDERRKRIGERRTSTIHRRRGSEGDRQGVLKPMRSVRPDGISYLMTTNGSRAGGLFSSLAAVRERSEYVRSELRSGLCGSQGIFVHSTNYRAVIIIIIIIIIRINP